jgi:dihydrofolate reductase
MKVTLWMAMSVNGFIARENQSEDFLTSPLWQMFLELVRAADVVIWGRSTHELFVDSVRREIPDVRGLVLTRDEKLPVPQSWFRAASPAAVLETLAAHGLTRPLLAGGSKTNQSFACAGLIDEVVLALEPVIIGRGIPLVGPETPDLRLELLDIDRSRKQKIKLIFRVLKDTK